MRKLEASDIRSLGLFKHYRLVRKWACKTQGISDADLELLIFFDCIGYFTKNDYMNGNLTCGWDKHRWDRLLKDGWIVVWREHNRTTQKYNLYKTSFKTSHLITRIYKILLGEEDIPENKNSSKIFKQKTYTDKVLSTAINVVNKDKTRWSNG
jgi:hypothetical protein